MKIIAGLKNLDGVSGYTVVITLYSETEPIKGVINKKAVEKLYQKIDIILKDKMFKGMKVGRIPKPKESNGEIRQGIIVINIKGVGSSVDLQKKSEEFINKLKTILGVKSQKGYNNSLTAISIHIRSLYSGFEKRADKLFDKKPTGLYKAEAFAGYIKSSKAIILDKKKFENMLIG